MANPPSQGDSVRTGSYTSLPSNLTGASQGDSVLTGSYSKVSTTSSGGPLDGFASWALIWLVLMSMAQFGSTETLAAAFAWLIFIAVLMAYGAQAAANWGNFTSGFTNIFK